MLLSHFSVTLRLSYQEQNEQMNPETNIPAFTDEMAAPFAELVSKSQKVVLTCHVNADGDALGSTLGFRKALINMGKEASVITPDPSVSPVL